MGAWQWPQEKCQGCLHSSAALCSLSSLQPTFILYNIPRSKVQYVSVISYGAWEHTNVQKSVCQKGPEALFHTVVVFMVPTSDKHSILGGEQQPWRGAPDLLGSTATTATHHGFLSKWRRQTQNTQAVISFHSMSLSGRRERHLLFPSSQYYYVWAILLILDKAK